MKVGKLKVFEFLKRIFIKKKHIPEEFRQQIEEQKAHRELTNIFNLKSLIKYAKEQGYNRDQAKEYIKQRYAEFGEPGLPEVFIERALDDVYKTKIEENRESIRKRKIEEARRQRKTRKVMEVFGKYKIPVSPNDVDAFLRSNYEKKWAFLKSYLEKEDIRNFLWDLKQTEEYLEAKEKYEDELKGILKRVKEQFNVKEIKDLEPKQKEEYINSILKERRKLLEKYEKYFGKEETEKLKERELKIRERLKGKKVSLWQHTFFHLEKVLGTILLFIIGILVSSILGNPWFVGAFASWAVYVILPEPRDELNPIKKKIIELEKQHQKGEITAEDLKAQVDAEMAIAKLIEDKKTKEIINYQKKRAGKYIFKLSGFILFTLAFAQAPLMKPLAIITALISYYMVE
ncbi:MAG: hypothetical protein DRP13_03230 [Candidatus Aenigmatarchaeota archaeon]|nr:MAG: hypothetical protein DRP13_03230 [Candidatus Aenigmarchaeota archaeon]